MSRSFAGAPVTLAIIGCVTVASLTFSVLNLKHYLHLPLSPHLTRDHQYWRLALHHVAFSNSEQVLFGVLVLWTMCRYVERLWGGRKYLAFIVVSLLVNTAVELGAMFLLARFGFSITIPSGPFALLFSLAAQWSRLMPSTFKMNIFGLEVTSKVFPFAYLLQLLLSRFPSPLLPCLIGFLSSSLCLSQSRRLTPYIPSRLIPEPPAPSRHSVGTIQDFWRMSSTNVARARPRATIPVDVRPGARMGRMASHYWETLTGSAPSMPAAVPVAAGTGGAGTGTGQGVGQGADGAQPPRTELQPTTEQVALLQSLFPDTSRDRVLQALQRSENDPNRAVEVLLQQQSR